MPYRGIDRRLTAGVLTGVLALAAALRIYALDFGPPHTDTRPDETVIRTISLQFFGGDWNPHFFEYPSLYYYLLHGAYRLMFIVGYAAGTFTSLDEFLLTSRTNPAPFYLTARSLSALFGTLTVWLTYRLARRVTDRGTALVAAFFLAVTYAHVRDSHFGVADTAVVGATLAAMIAVTRVWARPERSERWIVAGAVTGLASSMKYNAGAVAAVAVAIALSTLGSAAGRQEWRRTTLAVFALFAAAAIGFVAGTPYALLDSTSFFAGLATQARHLEEGHAGLDLGRGWTHHAAFSLRYGLGVPLLACAIGGAVRLAIREWRKAVLVCTFPVIYYAVIGAGRTVFARYMTPIVPFLCVMAAIAIAEAARRLASTARLPAPLVTIIAAGLVVVPTAMRSVEFDRVLAQTDTRVLAARWLKERMQAGDTLYESGFTAGWVRSAWRGADRDRPVLQFDERRSVFANPSGGETVPRWVVIQESPLSAYSNVPPALRLIVHDEYDLAASFSAVRHPEHATIFDRQDAFFLPYARFTDRIRPGPELSVYRRK